VRALGFSEVHHIERQNYRNRQQQQLGQQVKIALERRSYLRGRRNISQLRGLDEGTVTPAGNSFVV
jgi:hypothetical protein